MSKDCVNQKYSVLMSVYAKEKAEYLQESMESMFSQTIKSDDFILVCDGPLGEELNKVIEEMETKYAEILHVIRLEKNMGLGNALNYGLKYCKYDLVARMDSDDISISNRCEKELEVFCNHSGISIVSGTILEFEKTTQKVIGKRSLPKLHKEICKFSRKRNPFNHPVVMFRKSAVQDVGGYSEEYPLFEDYYLWIRMLRNGNIGYNLQEPILYMRISTEMYLRRGGKKYASDMLKFHKWMKKVKWSDKKDYLTGAVPHALVCLIPNGIRKIVYNQLHK